MTYTRDQDKRVLFEGLSESEILDLPPEQIDALVLTGKPIVFSAGSASVLGELRMETGRLIVELAQIDGGGEGVLLSIGSLAKRYARVHGIEAVEWIVHAVTCAKPNLKLRRILERRGFVVRDIVGIGPAYHFLDDGIVARDKVQDAEVPARTGWAEASQAIADAGDDALVLGEFANAADAELKW